MTTICNWCNQSINGKYVRYEDGDLCCESCRARISKCDRCGKPLRDGTRWTLENKTIELCGVCRSQTGYCTACAMPILKAIYTWPRYPDRKFCEKCAHRREQCDFCSAPMTSGGVVYSDGRMSCNECRSTAVTDQSELDGLDREARQWFAKRLGIVLRSPADCPARLADAAKITRLQGRHFAATPGFDPRESGLFQSSVKTRARGGKEISREEVLAVWVESGLPRQDAYGTLVHELGHLWQFQSIGQERTDRRLTEGSACWLQYHALLDRGAKVEAEIVASRRDPVYGEGFRAVQAIEEKYGLLGTLQIVLDRLAPVA
jgi:hypothetical protein